MTPKSEEKLKNINTLVAEIKQLASEKQELSATRQLMEGLAASYFEFQHKNTVLKTIPDTEIKSILLNHYSQHEEELRVLIVQKDDLLEDLLSGRGEVKSKEELYFIFNPGGGTHLSGRSIDTEHWTIDPKKKLLLSKQDAENNFKDLRILGYQNLEILPESTK